jgi:hypothetical protein
MNTTQNPSISSTSDRTQDLLDQYVAALLTVTFVVLAMDAVALLIIFVLPH